MTDVLIVSDTHGKRERLERLISYRQKQLRSGDVLNLIFLGDGLVDLYSCSRYGEIITHAVRGNCDFGVPFGPFGEDIPETAVITLGGYRIFVSHGHTLDVKSTRARLYEAAAAADADIALFGHTHAPLEEYITNERVRSLKKPLAVFNPGSLGDFSGSFGNLSISDNGCLLSFGKYDNIK